MAKYEKDLIRKPLVLYIPRVCNASGYMYANGKFVVQKGSKIRFRRKSDVTTFDVSKQELTAELVDCGVIVNNVFEKNYVFESRALASDIIMQKNYICDSLWKDPETGKTIQEMKRDERFRKVEEKNLSSSRIPESIKKKQSTYWACFSDTMEEELEDESHSDPLSEIERKEDPVVNVVTSTEVLDSLRDKIASIFTSDMFCGADGVTRIEGGFSYKGRRYLEKDGYIPCIFSAEKTNDYSGKGVFRFVDNKYVFVLLRGSFCRHVDEIYSDSVNKIVNSIPEYMTRGDTVVKDIEFKTPGYALIFLCRFNNGNSNRWKTSDGTGLPDSEVYKKITNGSV